MSVCVCMCVCVCACVCVCVREWGRACTLKSGVGWWWWGVWTDSGSIHYSPPLSNSRDLGPRPEPLRRQLGVEQVQQKTQPNTPGRFSPGSWRARSAGNVPRSNWNKAFRSGTEAHWPACASGGCAPSEKRCVLLPDRAVRSPGCHLDGRVSQLFGVLHTIIWFVQINCVLMHMPGVCIYVHMLKSWFFRYIFWRFFKLYILKNEKKKNVFYAQLTITVI